MHIERDKINVGAYYVFKVDLRDGIVRNIQYYDNYDSALYYANSSFTAESGCKHVVLEVQGIVQAQSVPDVVTSLTRRM